MGTQLGTFGLSERQIRDLRSRNLAAQAAALGGGNPFASLAFLGGAQAGNLFAEAVSSAFGAADPEIQRARSMEEIRRRFEAGEIPIEDLPGIITRFDPQAGLEMQARIQRLGLLTAQTEATVAQTEATRATTELRGLEISEAQRQAEPENIARRERLADAQVTRAEAEAGQAVFDLQASPGEVRRAERRLQLQERQVALQQKQLLDAQNANVNQRADFYSGRIDQFRSKLGYDQLTQAYLQLRQQVEGIAASESPNVTDTAIAFNFAKMLSPGIVTESDAQLAVNASSIPGRLKSMLSKALGEGGLQAGERRQIANEAATILDNANNTVIAKMRGQAQAIVQNEQGGRRIVQNIISRQPLVKPTKLSNTAGRTKGVTGEDVGKALGQATGQALEFGASAARGLVSPDVGTVFFEPLNLDALFNAILKRKQ